MFPTNISSLISGSRNASRKAKLSTHHSCTRILVADGQARSAYYVIDKCHLSSLNRRTQFTEEDEQNLCNWIAAKIPYKETGGRTGNRLYQQLCELVSVMDIRESRTEFTSRVETLNMLG